MLQIVNEPDRGYLLPKRTSMAADISLLPFLPSDKIVALLLFIFVELKATKRACRMYLFSRIHPGRLHGLYMEIMDTYTKT
jgi:hypothetical protein